MQQITHSDMVMHYRRRLSEIDDAIEKLQNEITASEKLLDTAWTGENAEILRQKLWEIKKRLARLSGDISEARQLLEKIQILAELSGN